MVADPGIAARIREVEERLAAACRRAGRTREDVAVVAVTKGLGIEAVRSGRAAGMAHFGENYARELLAKRTGAPDATWHFLGRLQRNKVRRVVGSVEVIHSVEPGGAASRLADLMAEAGGGPRCLVQVDFVGHRVGVGPDGAGRFLDELRRSEDVAVVGLMTIPPLGEDPRPYFARLRGLRERLRGDHPGLRELSMGMSADYEEAVEEGATMVRIGTAIFGPRPGAVHGTAGKP